MPPTPPCSDLDLQHQHPTWAGRCFILSLRDPVARLSSQFSFEHKHGPNWGHDMHAFSKVRRTRSPSELVTALRSSTHKSHAVARALFNGSLASNKRWGRKKRNALQTGSCGLIPQVDYLLGLEDLDDVELHVVCTHRFDADWADLLHRFDAANSSSVGAVQGAIVARAPHVNQNRGDLSWLSMSKDEEVYVRHCMFPEDTWLARRLCDVACDHQTHASARAPSLREIAAALEARD